MNSLRSLVLLGLLCVAGATSAAAPDCPYAQPVAMDSFAGRLVKKGAELSAARKDAEAAALYRDYLDRHPRDGAILVAYAGTLMALRDVAGAQQALERALALPPSRRGADTAELKESLAATLYMQGKYAEVIGMIEPLLKDPCAHLRDASGGAYAGALFFSGRPADAAAVTAAMIDRGSRLMLAFVVNIEAHTALKQTEAAARTVVLAAGLPTLTAADRQLIAESARDLARDPAARRLLEEAQAAGTFDAQWMPLQSGPSSLAELMPIYAEAPVYPREAARRRTEGYVDVEITVTAAGDVADARVATAQPSGVFDEAALAAARNSRFRPRVVDGQPVGVRSIRRYNFTMAP